MALDRFQNLPLDRQRDILRVAAKAFAEHGYEGTSYNDLLRQLGMGKSQAYYYFADKADLFVTACATCYEEYYDEVARLPQPASKSEVWEYVRKLHYVGFRYQKAHPVAAQLTLAVARSPSRFQLSRAVLEGPGSSTEQYRQWLELGRKLGAVRTDLPEDFLVHQCMQTSALVDAWFAERAATATPAQMRKWAAQFADLSRRMLEPGSPRSSNTKARRRTKKAPR